MTLVAIIAAVWLFGPGLLFLALFALGEWLDRRRRQVDERGLALFVALEQSWELPPAERRRDG